MSILPSEASDYFDVPNHRVQWASNSLPNLIDADAKGGSNVASRKRKKMDSGMPPLATEWLSLFILTIAPYVLRICPSCQEDLPRW